MTLSFTSKVMGKTSDFSTQDEIKENILHSVQ